MKNNVIIKSGNHNINLHTNDVDNPQKIILCLHGFNGNLWGDGFSILRKSFNDALVCSFDSAGHGESEVSSLEMRMDLICKEVFDTVDFLAKKFRNVPIFIFALSYGAYRTITTLFHYGLPNVKYIVFANPAFKMLKVLQKLKNFNYFELKDNSIVPMKQKLNKYLTKAFLDDIYIGDVYSLKFKQIPTTIFIGTQDTLIERQDTLDFAKLHNCTIKYLNDDHCVNKQESWEEIIRYLEDLKWKI